MDLTKILFTGGSGLLGNEVRQLIPEALFPGHEELDIMNYNQIDSFIKEHDINTCIHAAAFTSPPKINEDPKKAIDCNIIGSSNITKACMKYNIKLIYISTDYIFQGDQGRYKETDSVLPQNKYAWSKLGGECAAVMYENSLIIRTSFSENEFPYDKAFTDQWTSRLPVSDFAEKLVDLVLSGIELSGVIHIGGPRRTVFDYAKAISPEKKIGKLSLGDVSFAAPKDSSLDISKYNDIFSNRIEQEKKL